MSVGLSLCQRMYLPACLRRIGSIVLCGSLSCQVQKCPVLHLEPKRLGPQGRKNGNRLKHDIIRKKQIKQQTDSRKYHFPPGSRSLYFIGPPLSPEEKKTYICKDTDLSYGRRN